jgi:hypothetical protein
LERCKSGYLPETVLKREENKKIIKVLNLKALI